MRSRLDGPVETVRPSVGAGSGTKLGGGAQVGGAQVVKPIDPAKHIGAELVRVTAREVALTLLRDHARSLCRVMGLAYDEMALVLKTACVEFGELHAHAATPTG